MYKIVKKISHLSEKIDGSGTNTQHLSVHSRSDKYFEEFATLMKSFGSKNGKLIQKTS